MTMLHSVIPGPALAEMMKMATSAPPGPFVEFGVYQGGSADRLYSIARVQRRQLHLFDTFTGTPWQSGRDGNRIGGFDGVDLGHLQSAMQGAIFHAGLFPNTLPPLKQLDGIAFAHIDCDQYASTKFAIRAFWPRMKEGGIMLFDDYGQGGCDGATAAVDSEFMGLIHRTENDRGYKIKGDNHGVVHPDFVWP